MLHHNNLVRIADRTQSMRHNYDSLLPATDQLVKRLLYLVLRFGVQCRSSLVKKKKFGLANQCTCNCYALLLSAREFDATFTDKSLISQREQVHIVDKVICI